MHTNIESNVSYYNLHFPAKFAKAKNALLYSEENKQYIDFFSAAGSLNYGHNNEYMKKKIIYYLETDNIIQGLDMDTVAKEDFLLCFQESILKPRGLKYKLQLCGPTGTNAVEAALRLARKVTGRSNIFALSGSFHGMTTGSVAVSSTKKLILSYLPNNQDVTFIPYSITDLDDYDPIKYIEFLLNYEYSGVGVPAALIFESIQAEGGVNVLGNRFLSELQDVCNRHKVLLICDDIQVGCFRTGTFFSFERSGITPDLVILSKSISGYGIPMAILLIKPSFDIWESGEYSGTFRGNQLAFVGAKAAIEFGLSSNISEVVNDSSQIISSFLYEISKSSESKMKVRGKGMIWGIDLNPYKCKGLGLACSKECFNHGLIIEVCGINHNVLKIMPPLTIEDEFLLKGLEIVKTAIQKGISTIKL